MPISPTAPPSVSDLPDAPNSSTQTPDQFDSTANDFVEAQVAIVPEYNALAQWQEGTAQEVYDNAVESANSATSSANSAAASAVSANAAQTAANFLGIWSSLTGSVSISDKVENDGAIWAAAIAIADITASEPSATNSDWVFVSGNTFIKITSSMNVIPNAKIQISATSTAVDLTLVPMDVNDNFTMRNNSNSTELVRLVNTTYTIIGNKRTIPSSDNIVFKPSATLIFVCRAANVLEIL